MASDLRENLRRLPRLDSKNRDRNARLCKICSTPAPFFDSVDFNKVCSDVDPYMFGPADITVEYFQCPACDFIFADEIMSWSADDLAELIYNEDYIKVDVEYVEARPTRMARTMATLLEGCETARILDYGSGSGRLAQVMADHGFTDVTSYDPFSSPDRPEGEFDILLCFEVIEHSRDPRSTLADIASLMKKGGCLIFSQTLQPPDLDRKLGTWWYLAPRNGHISLFSPRTFERLAAEQGMTFSAFGNYGQLYALSFSERSALASRALTDARPFCSLLLAAPRDDGLGWNEIERPPEGPLRWSASETIEWKVATTCPPPFNAQVTLPFAAEIVSGFAASSSIAWGGDPVPVTVKGNRIQVDLIVNDTTSPIVLRTPAPMRPDDLNGCGDRRLLGLYVPLDVAPQ